MAIQWDPVNQGDMEEITKQFGKSEFMKLKVGKTRLRVVPGRGRKTFMSVQQHRVEIPGEQYARRYTCPGKGCPICARAAELSRSGNPKDSEAAYQLRATVKVFCNVIDRADPESGPKVWEFGKKVWGQVESILSNEDAGGDFTDPNDGFDLIVDRKGTGKNDTEYKVLAARQASPLSEDDAAAEVWIDGAPDLSPYTQPKSLDEMRRALGIEEDDDEPPAPRRGLPPKAGQAKRRSVEDDLDA
jgi:hypothetical protein